MPKNKDNIKLSILILSIPSRFGIVRPLIDKLMRQIGEREDVEILSLMDNKSLHIWEKRNELMRIARGSHITWLDDDDDVSDEYVSKLTETIESNPNVDVISFDQMCYLNGMEARVFAEMGNPHEDVVVDPYNKSRFADTLRPPYHWCCWKTSLASSEEFRASFSHGNVGQSTEDIDWLRRLYPKVKESVYLQGHYLHIYRWSNNTTESVL
tara:strand:+ start:3086 stop:3718 length:633 start_codon:yes stop_codon:yes gene_type:complete